MKKFRGKILVHCQYMTKREIGVVLSESGTKVCRVINCSNIHNSIFGGLSLSTSPTVRSLGLQCIRSKESIKVFVNAYIQL